MNRSFLVFAGAAALTLGAAGAASAQLPWPFGPAQGQPYGQPYGQGAQTITFYVGPNYTGRQVTVFGEERNFSSIGFNDRARSARASGSWLICEDSEFRGRCERI